MSDKASFSSAAFAYDRLIAGDADDLIGRKVTLASGQSLVRGALLGKITTGGKYTLSLAVSNDGSQTPDVVLAEDCDATTADAEALVYVRGDFNASAVTFGTGHTATSVRDGLRSKGIFLIDVQGA